MKRAMTVSAPAAPLAIRPRRSALRLAWTAAAAALLLCGCRTPTPAEIQQQVTAWRQALLDLVNHQIQLCDRDEACQASWRAWLQEQLNKLNEYESLGLEQKWEDAAKHRQALEQKIRGMFPGWPGVEDVAPWPRRSTVNGSLGTTAGVGQGRSPDSDWRQNITSPDRSPCRSRRSARR